MFKDAQIGDRVWDIRYGWGIIVNNTHQGINERLILCRFNEKECYHFTVTGKSLPNDLHPTLFWNEFKIPQEAFIKPLPKLEKDTKVLVWDDSSEIKEKRYFSHFNRGRMYCYDQGCTSWLGTTTHDWDNWELFKG